MPWEEVAAHVRAAEVILVGDTHSRPACQWTFASIVSEFADRELLIGGRCAVALELLSAAKQDNWDWIFHGPGPGHRERWEAYLEGVVTIWPLAGTRETIPLLSECGVRVLGAGGRDPDRTAAAALHAWLRRGGRGQVFVEFGTAHLVGGPGSLTDELRLRGVRTLVLVAGDRAWDEALYQHFGEGMCGQWFEVLPGVLRAPPAADVLDRLYRDDCDTVDPTKRRKALLYRDYNSSIRKLLPHLQECTLAALVTAEVEYEMAQSDLLEMRSLAAQECAERLERRRQEFHALVRELLQRDVAEAYLRFR